MGSTVDQLLDRANGDDIEFLSSLEFALQEKSDREGVNALSEEEKAVLAIEALEREVNNGGYNLFYTNSSSEFAPIIVDSLLLINCTETAKITRRAIEAIKPEKWEGAAIAKAVASYAEEEGKHWVAKARGAVYQRQPVDSTSPSPHDAIWNELNECDKLYYSAGENIGGLLIEFVKAHKTAIRP